MGNVNVTTQNLKVVQLRSNENLLLVGGAIPGAAGAMVIVRKALKKTKAGQAK
jgi:large subunit ribosomal protein L3